ncbi:MAG: class I SAM-dependent methyltransferase [Anaerolineae bacterium]|nr:class I SAM-dependent methyltransferase [Anaerolineae bacterium]
MSGYDNQYTVEENLFGSPYKEFEDFVRNHALNGGKALDLGCGQGRDALMLAQYGYRVTGVDSSKVGVAQMLARAKARNLAVDGVVGNFHEYEPDGNFDAIVLDSILHFEPADRKKELALLDKVSSLINVNGHLFVFVHKSSKKEQELKNWLAGAKSEFDLIEEGYINYTYQEKATRFKSEFQFYMFIVQRVTTITN